MAVVFTFVLCQALHSDRKGKFPVFLRKNSIAYESMGRRLNIALADSIEDEARDE